MTAWGLFLLSLVPFAAFCAGVVLLPVMVWKGR